jgi:hypothetical protein
MAFGIISIYKIFEKDSIGYYEISSDHFDVKNFYVAINRPEKIIAFYMTNDFLKEPIRTIDFNRDQNQPMGALPGVPTKVFSVVILQAIRAFKMDFLPESLSWAA